MHCKRKVSHTPNWCSKNKSSPVHVKPEDVACRNCNRTGHETSTCPAPPPGDNATLVVTVNTSATRQSIWGFGGAVTEAAVSVFAKLAPAAQEAVLAMLYGEAPDNSSLRYEAGRLTIGSCDFALGY